jgi:hypothetical protein
MGIKERRGGPIGGGAGKMIVRITDSLFSQFACRDKYPKLPAIGLETRYQGDWP